MPKNVRLKLNAREGSINLQCSEDFYESAMEQCQNIISTYFRMVPVETDKLTKSTKSDEKILVPGQTTTVPATKTEPIKPKRQRSPSGKPANYTQVDLGLTDEQSRELRAFYKEKEPKTQNDIVCVVAFKLRKFLSRDVFTTDDIFSGLRIIGGVTTPKDLRAVFKNISNKGYGAYGDSKFTVNFATEDYVTLELPVKKKD